VIACRYIAKIWSIRTVILKVLTAVASADELKVSRDLSRRKAPGLQRTADS
jgi:hypothetical protein